MGDRGGDTVASDADAPVRGVRERIELAAPDWMVELVRLKPAAISWPDVVRVAVAIPTPLAVGIAVGQPPLGLFAAMGAMAASIADRGGPIRMRLVRQLGAGIAGAVGMYLGHLAAGTGWLSVLVVALASLASALLSVINAATSMAGLQLLVYVSIASGLTVPFPPLLLPVLYLVGAAWAMLLSTVVALVGGTRTPEREAVADVYRGVADLLDATGTDGMADARQRLTTTMNTAYDALLSGRSRSAGRNPTFRQLTALLNAATPVVEASVAIAHSGRGVPPDVPAGIRAVADAISAERPPPPMPAALRSPDSYRLRALRNGMADVRERLKPDHEAAKTTLLPPTPRERLIRLTDRVLTGPTTWQYAVRLVLCMSLAEILRGALPLERSYWVLLTVAIVLKPDFGSVFARAVQRGLGTLLGVLIGAGLLVVVPKGAWLLPFIAVAAGLLPIVMGRNYGMFAIFLTPLAVLLVDFGANQGPEIVVTRLLDTLTGCAIVLVFGYLLWPETWRVHLGPQVADAVDELATYLREAFGAETSAARAQRRRTYRTLSDVRTSFQQKLAEPPPVSTRAAAWWPMIVQLERAVDAVTEVAIRTRDAARAQAAVRRRTGEEQRAGDDDGREQPTEAAAGGTRVSAEGVARQGAPAGRRGADGGPRPPSSDSVNLLVADLRDLATALRERRSPDEIPTPRDEVLAPIAAEVRAARQLATGPAPADRSLGQV
ncbi:FUSC family protein [Actinocatenispora rupis]|uniref:Membrane protein n=1 Tax=Actinocatenispora rupis TaxID=519421 RepID=A0A8J3JFP3_9ACTN|nr:FUSC family protein [Actinocatenispora rupis]GID15088.1 membrane protein [Actinocatenispora rupis]